VKQSDFMRMLVEALAPFRSMLDDTALARFEAHWRLLNDWGGRLNLTSIKDAESAVWRHYRDSLEPIRVLGEGPWADMGSGAGFPGIPLAIVRPEVSLTLVEPRRKRVSFLKTAVAELGLEHVRVFEGRSTDTPPRRFRAVLTRATFSQPEALQDLKTWCASGGIVVALRSEPLVSGARAYSYSLRGERRVMEVW